MLGTDCLNSSIKLDKMFYITWMNWQGLVEKTGADGKHTQGN